MAKVRILRVLEYIGDEEMIWHILKQNAVPSDGEKDFGNVLIRSAIVGYPEYLTLEKEGA